MSQELPVKIGWVLYRIKDNWKKEFLLLKRTEQDGWFWQYLTWTLHNWESFIDCLKREIFEETWFWPENIKNIGEMFHSFTWNKKSWQLIHEFVYSVELHFSDKQPLLSETEHDDYARDDYGHAMNTLFTENNKKCLAIFHDLKWE